MYIINNDRYVYTVTFIHTLFWHPQLPYSKGCHVDKCQVHWIVSLSNIQENMKMILFLEQFWAKCISPCGFKGYSVECQKYLGQLIWSSSQNVEIWIQCLKIQGYLTWEEEGRLSVYKSNISLDMLIWCVVHNESNVIVDNVIGKWGRGRLGKIGVSRRETWWELQPQQHGAYMMLSDAGQELLHPCWSHDTTEQSQHLLSISCYLYTDHSFLMRRAVLAANVAEFKPATGFFCSLTVIDVNERFCPKHSDLLHLILL